VNDKGFALILAVFMLVVFSIIGFVLVNIVTYQNVESVEELQSVQALFLAESGAEIAVTECLNDDTKCQIGTYDYTFLDNNKKMHIEIKDKILFNGANNYTVESTGIIGQDVKRKIRVKFRK
jgi:MSHA biogenesis protein MshP